MVNPLFQSTSSDKPSLLTVTFEGEDPGASLGAQLCKADHGATSEMFIPSYATIGRLLDGETVAKKCGVHVGDCIVAVNGQGFRRFAPDFADDELQDLSATSGDTKKELSDEEKKQKATVVPSKGSGEAYAALLAKIKEIKGGATTGGGPPLLLQLERHGWDERANSWGRFLAARDGDVPKAMMMLQTHEEWRAHHFPIDLTKPKLQEILKLKAISEIDTPTTKGLPPTVYVNYSKLQQLESTQDPEDVVTAFVIFTEMMLKLSPDPRHPKACQLIDLTGVSISSGFRVDILKQIYAAFEPNYPETLSKMVMYPVSKTVSVMAKTLLSFVNEKTQQKFVITDSFDKACEELGWDKQEVEAAGGLQAFVEKEDKAGDSMIFG